MAEIRLLPSEPSLSAHHAADFDNDNEETDDLGRLTTRVRSLINYETANCHHSNPPRDSQKCDNCAAVMSNAQSKHDDNLTSSPPNLQASLIDQLWSSPRSPVQEELKSKQKTPRKPPKHTSPFWATPSTSPSKPPLKSPKPTPFPKKPRPPPNTIPSLPFPPLSSPRFGLLQEELATDPFALLVATTFLTKTKATAAIPVFREVRGMFPTPEAMAEADEVVLEGLIKPLGLSKVRARKLKKMGERWVKEGVRKERRVGVTGYNRSSDGMVDVMDGEEFGVEDEEGEGEGVNAVVDAKKRGLGRAWEIGHITKGGYALDSWRIFCRDVLLGRAEDCKGTGPKEEFQPEWMRVLPRDKELRAFLRWMWMQEGWMWDPETGEREVLGEEMARAVEEGRVRWDDGGRLVVLGEEEKAVRRLE